MPEIICSFVHHTLRRTRTEVEGFQTETARLENLWHEKWETVEGHEHTQPGDIPKTCQGWAGLEGPDGCQGKEGPGLLREAPTTGPRLGWESYRGADWDLISAVSFLHFCFLATRLVGFSVPRPGIEPRPWQWKPGILTTGPPGNSRAISSHS